MTLMGAPKPPVTVDGGFGTLPGSSIELNAGLGSVLLAIQHPIFRGVKVKTVATTNTADFGITNSNGYAKVATIGNVIG